jgi:hypothetical protein
MDGGLVSPILSKLFHRDDLDKMKYICLKNCIINKTPTMCGTVLEVDPQEANMLLGIGRIAPYHEDDCDNRSIGLEISSEVVMKRRGRPRKV